jgi:chemotaxis protein histidine kinase CheA
MDFDLSEYMGAYIDGSRENLDAMDRSLLSLEQNPQNLDAVEEIFRAAHTLKGMSATMGFEKVAHLTHDMESVLDKLRTRQIPVTAAVIDIIFETFDVLRTLVSDSISQTDSNVDMSLITGKLNSILTGEVGGVADAAPAAASVSAEDAAPEAGPSLSGGGGLSAGVLAELAELEISDFEISGLMDLIQSGQHSYLVRVSLVSDCLLKGPRIFMVLRLLDSLQAEIVKSVPEVKDLENEKFDRSFKMVVTTTHTAEEVRFGIESISEIETVEVMPLSAEDLHGEGTATYQAVSAPPLAPAPASAPFIPPSPVAAATPTAVVSPAPPPKPVHTPPPVSSVQAPAPSPNIPSAPFIDAPPPGDVPPSEGGWGSGFEEEKQREAIELVQLVSFRMAGETYALDIKEVEAIINLVPITRVPKAQNHYEGVINLRGEIVPVVSLRRRLKLPKAAEGTVGNQIIILSFESEKVKVGFLVDTVQEVIRLPATAIEPPSHVSDSVEIEHLKGVGKIGTKIIILLNAHRIVFN